ITGMIRKGEMSFNPVAGPLKKSLHRLSIRDACHQPHRRVVGGNFREPILHSNQRSSKSARSWLTFGPNHQISMFECSIPVPEQGLASTISGQCNDLQILVKLPMLKAIIEDHQIKFTARFFPSDLILANSVRTYRDKSPGYQIMKQSGFISASRSL